jgi:hypothetical protein
VLLRSRQAGELPAERPDPELDVLPGVLLFVFLGHSLFVCLVVPLIAQQIRGVDVIKAGDVDRIAELLLIPGPLGALTPAGTARMAPGLSAGCTRDSAAQTLPASVPGLPGSS